MNRVRWLLALLLAMPFVAGCDPVIEIRIVSGTDLTPTAAASADATAGATSPTALPDTPQAGATLSPTEIPRTAVATATASSLPTVTPTAAPGPTRPPATATTGPRSGATRIRFRTGAIAGTVSGQLASGDSRLYVLGAGAGQIMEVVVVTQASGVSFSIWGQDGTVLKAHAQNRAAAVLPSSQDYYIALYSSEQAARYELTVTIPPLSRRGPVRIRFAPGGISAAVQGRLAPGACSYYVLEAQAGQRMEVQVSPGDIVGLDVRGQGGSWWSSGPEGIVVVEQLPRSGDYYLTLCTPSSAETTGYTLQVTIPPR